MTPINKVNRRDVMKALAGAAGVAGTAGAGALLFLGPTTATSIGISNTETATDDGDLSFVDLDLGNFFAIWDGFDRPVAAVAFRDRVVHVGSGQSHELFDQRGDDADPVLLTEISTQGNGGDGWGGPGEYASTFDTKTEPSVQVINEPGVGGPAQATAGFVHADVFWRLATDDPTDTGHSIETPAVLGEDLPAMDNPDDGTIDWHTLRLIKEVYLYRLPGEEEAGDLVTQSGQPVVLMGGDDGTVEKIQATPTFQVGVRNDVHEEETQGGGSAESG